LRIKRFLPLLLVQGLSLLERGGLSVALQEDDNELAIIFSQPVHSYFGIPFTIFSGNPFLISEALTLTASPRVRLVENAPLRWLIFIWIVLSSRSNSTSVIESSGISDFFDSKPTLVFV